MDKGYKFILVNSNVKRPEGGLAATAYNTRRQELIDGAHGMEGFVGLGELLGKAWAPHVSCYSLHEFFTIAEQIPEPYRSRLRHVLFEKSTTLQCVEAAEVGDVELMCELLNASGISLSMAGDFQISALINLATGEIIDDTLDVLVTVACENGASGRMHGGGGGGCAIFLLRRDLDTPEWKAAVDSEIAARVQENLGIERHVSFLGEAKPSKGAEILYSNPQGLSVSGLSGDQHIFSVDIISGIVALVSVIAHLLALS